jgi:hypothetical protein
LFSTAHSNISSSPAAPDDAHITAARLALRHQTDTLGRRIGLTPSAVLVPAELETSVEKLLTAIQATSVSDVNVFSFLTLVTEARLTGTTRWYVVSRDIPGLVVLRLEGRAGPQVESQIDFNTKSVRYSVLNDFAIAVADWRPWYADGVAS